MAKLRTFNHKSIMPGSADDDWNWHSREGALERLMPPWENITITRKDIPVFKTGAQVEFVLRTGPLAQRWLAEHTDIEVGRSFTDKEVQGPLTYWLHNHKFNPIDEQRHELEDDIEYRLPAWAEYAPFGPWFANRRLERLFRYRHRVVKNDLETIRRYPLNQSLRILVSGASGFIGHELCAFLGVAGHEVWQLVRREEQGSHEIFWNPYKGVIDKDRLEGFDAVIHLSGENIAGRWSNAKMERIRDSRVICTSFLADQLNSLEKPPAHFLCGSAVGYYGDRGDALVDEGSERGLGFLPEVCEEWEHAAQRYKKGRVVHLRTGVVLSSKGGALGQMLMPFLMGLGGRLGNGKQFFPWISMDDEIYQIYHVLMMPSIEGPVNLVAPNPIDNNTFTKALGRVLRRPTILPVPGFGARIAFGKMADEALLASNRILPSRLQQTGAKFAYPEIEQALCHVMGC